MNIKALIIDFDNTLVNTQEFVRSHIKETWEELGVKPPQPAKINRILKANLPFEEIFVQLLGKDKSEKFLEAYRATAPDKPYVSCKGAIKFINDLAINKIPVIIVTNRLKMLKERLIQAGFQLAWFTDMLEAEFKKPDQRAYDTALKKLHDMHIADNFIYIIGDSIDDFQSCPVNFQANFLGLLTGFTTKPEWESAGVAKNKIYRTISEIPFN